MISLRPLVVQLGTNRAGPLTKASSSRGPVDSLVVGAQVPARGKRVTLSIRVTSTDIGDEKKVEAEVWREDYGNGQQALLHAG